MLRPLARPRPLLAGTSRRDAGELPPVTAGSAGQPGQDLAQPAGRPEDPCHNHPLRHGPARPKPSAATQNGGSLPPACQPRTAAPISPIAHTRRPPVRACQRCRWHAQYACGSGERRHRPTGCPTRAHTNGSHARCRPVGCHYCATALTCKATARRIRLGVLAENSSVQVKRHAGYSRRIAVEAAAPAVVKPGLVRATGKVQRPFRPGTVRAWPLASPLTHAAPAPRPGYRWQTCSRRPRVVTCTAGSTSRLARGSNQAKEGRT